MHSIGQIISENRKKLGLSQEDLAIKLQAKGFNLTRKAVSKWEQNATEPGISLFLSMCQILQIEDIYEAYFGSNPYNLFDGLNEEGKLKALDYISLLHDSGKYEKHVCQIISFRRTITVYENAVSAGTGNFLEDGPCRTLNIDEALLPENTSFGVKISGDSMEPEFHDGDIAWVIKQETVENGEIGIFSLNGDAYIKKLREDKDGIFLVSLNKKYAPIRVSENDRFDVFGKVVGTGSATDLSI